MQRNGKRKEVSRMSETVTCGLILLVFMTVNFLTIGISIIKLEDRIKDLEFKLDHRWDRLKSWLESKNEDEK